MPKFSIIIPVCNNYEYTRSCIESIKKHSTDYEIIVVDNGSNPPWRGEQIIIRNEKNEGFPIAVNQGIKKATGDVIVLLNNDTLVSPKWLDYLDIHLQNYDLVGPCSDNISGVQNVDCGEYKADSDFYLKASQYHEKNQGKSIPYNQLIFFCVAIKRKVINKIGYLDEIFTPGNFEDNDYCLRAIQAGFRCGVALDVLIHHERSLTHKTLNIDYNKLLKRNEKIFKDKWSQTRNIVLSDLNVRLCQPKTDEKYPTLALVMICRNEEKGLANAILSARGIVDFVSVSVDESSTDNTLEVAKLFADEVKTYKWCDNFAEARNEAHKDIKTDYIMFLDGHEYIKKGDKIKEYLKTGGDSFLCTVELDNDAVIRNPRIYKNGIQFDGKVHELQKDIHPKRAYNIVVRHDRINGQDQKSASIRDEQRDDQILRIMGQQLADNPKNGRASFHLALHYQTKQEWKKAIKMQKYFLKLSQVKSERWYVYFNMTFCYLALNKPFRAWLTAINADKETPQRWETAKLKGLILYNKKNFRKAAEFFVESLSMNQHDEAYKPWGREIEGTWNLIGECLFNQGMFWQAGEAFKKAVENSNDEKFKDFVTRRSDLMFEIAKTTQNNA